MKHLYWAFLIILIVLGLGVSIYFGLSPKPVPKIKPSQVETPERFGEAISQRLWAEIKDAQLIVLGVEPESFEDMKIWKGFLDSLSAAPLKYATIIMEPRLIHRGLIPHSDEIDINQDFARFVEGLKVALGFNQRIAVIVPTIYASQAIPANPINRLKAEIKMPFVSISIVQPTLTRDEENKSTFPCVTGSGDTRGLGSFGCLVQGKSRSLYRKKFESGKYLGLMDQIGSTDYLVLFRQVP